MEKHVNQGIGLAKALICCGWIAVVSGCTTSEHYSDAQLEQLRQEATDRNAEMVAHHSQDEQQFQWQLTVTGQILKPSQSFNWSQLQTLPMTTVSTIEPLNTGDQEEVLNFRGVPVSALLEKFGVAQGVSEVTFVSYDGYRVTVELEDLRQYPIILATECNGRKLSRSKGGPLYLVFPYSQYPQLQSKYNDRFWAFYVTDMIVGTEPIQLEVGNQTFDSADLQQFSLVTQEAEVNSMGVVKLHGVRIRDLIEAADITLPDESAVIVRGKPPVYSDTVNPVRLKAGVVKQCDSMLATYWGDNRQPIPAKLGGPVTLVVPSDCPIRSDKQQWVTFVEEVEVIN